MIKKEVINYKAWANKLIWRHLYDRDKPHPTALRMAYEVMGTDYRPYNPASKNNEMVDF